MTSIQKQPLRPTCSTVRLPGVVRGAGAVFTLGLLLCTTACMISKDKNSSGDGDNVKISTPFGGMKVNSNDMTAASVDLPAYPGATIVKKKPNGDDGSVDLHMGFASFQIRVKVVSYQTPDPQAKVLAFYRQALGKNGDVIECSGKTPIGTPITTPEGLNCADTEGGSKWGKSNVNINDSDIQLKTGSRHHQHIVGVKQEDGQTHFSLIALDLPSGDKEQETN